MNEITTPSETDTIIARWRGKPIVELPKDLYIPPDALEIFLDAFHGPLDFLLYLIKKHNMDVVDIPMASITEQYMAYVDVMKGLDLELAAEYLVMAAVLAEIKSRMLLPKSKEGTVEEDDPRAELVRRLQAYEQCKLAALALDELPQEGRDTFAAKAKPPELRHTQPLPTVDLRDVLFAFRDVMHRAALYANHEIVSEALSVRERMSRVLDRISQGGIVPFEAMFTVTEGRMGVVVTLIAILELVRESLIELTQSEPFCPIYLKAITRHESIVQEKEENHGEA